MPIIIVPEEVVISTASRSEMKSSRILCGMLFFIRMAVPSVILLVLFFRCVLYPRIFKDSFVLTPWLFNKIMSASACL